MQTISNKSLANKIINANKKRSNKMKDKIEIPVCYYEDDNGNKVYDLEAMAEEFENQLSEITGRVIMCSATEE